MPQPRVINGLAVSPGLAFGPVHVVRAARDSVPTWVVPAQEVDGEVRRLFEAIEVARVEFRRRQEIVAREAGAKDAEIFAVHRLVLQDPDALGRLEERIRNERINAEAALQVFIEDLEASLGDRLRGGIARNYTADLTDPWRGVLDCLLRDERAHVLEQAERVVLAAEELTPQVVTLVERSRILAIICTTGARYSHGGVLARAFGLPCVVGLPNLLGRLEQGMMVTVDGLRGAVQLRPEADDLAQFEELQRQSYAKSRVLVEQADQPAVTPDGERLLMMVNVESLMDFDMFDPHHTDGIGLLRTEFLYMERSEFPSEEEQFRLYRRAFERMDGRPVTLRTLDIGADKNLSYFKTPSERNPALGWRGTRLMLDWQDLLRVQLRAMLRAGAGYDLRILLPMISSLEEIRRVHEIFLCVREDLLGQGYEVNDDVPVGVMVEVPSLLFVMREVCGAVDFVSVGTNDLVQYLLAADRDNPKVAHYYEPQHPAVLQALRHVAEVSQELGKPCSVCGDLADDPVMALLLMGLGYESVSVAPHFVPEIKLAVRMTRAEDAGAFAREALACSDIACVRAALEGMRQRLSEAG